MLPVHARLAIRSQGNIALASGVPLFLDCVLTLENCPDNLLCTCDVTTSSLVEGRQKTFKNQAIENICIDRLKSRSSKMPITFDCNRVRQEPLAARALIKLVGSPGVNSAITRMFLWADLLLS